MTTLLGFLKAIAEAVAAIGRYLRDRQLIEAGRSEQKSEDLTEEQRRVQRANSAAVRYRTDSEYSERMRDEYRRD